MRRFSRRTSCLFLFSFLACDLCAAFPFQGFADNVEMCSEFTTHAILDTRATKLSRMSNTNHLNRNYHRQTSRQVPLGFLDLLAVLQIVGIVASCEKVLRVDENDGVNQAKQLVPGAVNESMFF